MPVAAVFENLEDGMSIDEIVRLYDGLTKGTPGSGANCDLIHAAEEAGFHVLLTTDKNLACQQDLKGRNIAMVVLGRNGWRIVKAVLSRIMATVSHAIPGSYAAVDVPDE